MGAAPRRRRARAARSPTEELPEDAVLALADAVAPLARAPAPARRPARGRARRRARAPLGAALVGRHLRPARPRLDARHVRGAGAGRRRRADRRLSRRRRAPGRRRRGAAARPRRGVGARRPAGDRALAYGTASIPRVDKIVGPGNAYVNEAKLLVSRDVAIDLPAGPSEVVVLAGRGADPRVASSSSPRRPSTGPTPSAASSTSTATSRRARRGRGARAGAPRPARR